MPNNTVSFNTNLAQPEWGHSLRVLDLDGNHLRTVRVPKTAFKMLRNLGLLGKRHAAVYEPAVKLTLKDPRLDALTLPLKMLLGESLAGPQWVTCKCKECQNKFGHLDNTHIPGLADHCNKMYQAENTRIVNAIKAGRKFK
jgi:hypothetical protein